MLLNASSLFKRMIATARLFDKYRRHGICKALCLLSEQSCPFPQSFKKLRELVSLIEDIICPGTFVVVDVSLFDAVGQYHDLDPGMVFLDIFQHTKPLPGLQPDVEGHDIGAQCIDTFNRARFICRMSDYRYTRHVGQHGRQVFKYDRRVFHNKYIHS